jgi:hypothetical protein
VETVTERIVVARVGLVVGEVSNTDADVMVAPTGSNEARSTVESRF